MQGERPDFARAVAFDAMLVEDRRDVLRVRDRSVGQFDDRLRRRGLCRIRFRDIAFRNVVFCSVILFGDRRVDPDRMGLGDAFLGTRGAANATTDVAVKITKATTIADLLSRTFINFLDPCECERSIQVLFIDP
ncbi:MAG: hypothetical protein QM811_19660 [Pirellulales bacterium]